MLSPLKSLCRSACRGRYRIAKKLKSESIQLWNILGFKNELSEKVLESVEIYNQAMEKYEENNFKEAGKLFIKANKLDGEDETPLVFAQRCKEFIEKGVPKNWDGVVNMTSK